MDYLVPCKKVRTKALWEQDRWMSYLPPGVARSITQKQRLEFLRYDSHGGKVPVDNPVMRGKLAARAVGDVGWFPYADELREMYFGGDYWPGGLAVVEDYLRRVCGLGPLRKEFGDKIVQSWLVTFLWYAFGFPDLVNRGPVAKR